VGQLCHYRGVGHSIVLAARVRATIADLERSDPKRLTKVKKCLVRLGDDPRYRGLATHRYQSLDDTFGEKIWESYVENRMPAAWRIWWFFGPEGNVITAVDLGPHP
jgi:hypothetical protein